MGHAQEEADPLICVRRTLWWDLGKLFYKIMQWGRVHLLKEASVLGEYTSYEEVCVLLDK